MAPDGESAPGSSAPTRSWLRIALLGALGMGAAFALILFAYELALARVPQHRAALERLVRAQTGLDVRFTELGLRWGWYGPEAVFRHVELDEPGTSEALLRAPELVVGFDAWRTLRSGHPEAGRIQLIAPEIDFSGAYGRRGVGVATTVAPRVGSAVSAAETSVLGRVAVLQRWRGGRIDIEGGTVRLPDSTLSANPVSVQIRRATLRRSDNEWNVAGLVFLPDRVGRSARVTLRVQGDLGQPAQLSGSLQVEGRRMLFPGSRDFLAGVTPLAQYLPRGGNGDVTLDLSFVHGQVVKAGGTVRAAALVFDEGAAPRSNWLVLDRLHGNWRATRVESTWRVRVESLDLVKGARFASLTFDTGDAAAGIAAVPGRWIRGSVEDIPLESVLAVARWLAPHFDLAGTQLDGTARNLTFDWSAGRPEGQRLQAAARLEDVSLIPRSKDFILAGLGASISGNESQLEIDVRSRTARLELTQSQQKPLADVHVASKLRVTSGRDGWQIATDEFLLEHQRASLTMSGSLQDDPTEPRIFATGTLRGADIPLVARLLGDSTAQAFGAAASRLTAGRIQNAEFALQGPISKLPFEGRGDGFTGSLTLRDAIISGGDLWPDAEGIDARLEWHGAQIQATIEAGNAGPFKLASAKAQWGADGRSATRLTGHVNGRLEDAIAWVRDHPRLREYAPDAGDIVARGDASFDFNVSVPPDGDGNARARVSTFLNGAEVRAVSGLPPLQSVTGSFTFEAGRDGPGHLQHSTLTGSWLGGPVTLSVGERREKGMRILAVQAQGTLDTQQLANLANAPGTVDGTTDWTGELAYLRTDEVLSSQWPRWRMRVDSNLLGVVSSLPEPFAKRSAAVVPVHLEVTGANDAALIRTSLGDRMRALFALKRRQDLGWAGPYWAGPSWAVDRGTVRLGVATPALPVEPVVLVRGRVRELDLPAYAMAWQRLRKDSLPTIRAQVVADEMLVVGRRYDEVSLRVERTDSGSDLLIDSTAVAGMARWPTPPASRSGPGGADSLQPAELHLTRLDLPDDALPSEGVGLIAALAPTASLAIDQLTWHGRTLGRLTASVAMQDNVLVVNDVRLVNASHDAHAVLRCQTALPTCRLSFTVDSTDAAMTLADFGFTQDLAASSASLNGDVEWRATTDQPWLASLRGTLNMRLTDGVLRGPPASSAGESAGVSAGPFALLAVPALVNGLDVPGAAGASLTKEQRALHFEHLEADYDLHDGQASTSNLHFDGDAEILMRGRMGLLAHDYDQQVWVLRGEERLPAAVRRFGATPGVAAAWLSLRELFGGSDRSQAVLRLQGSWDDPMVVAQN